MEMAFTAVFKKVPEGYIAFVEELAGANRQGATLEEARENLREHIAFGRGAHHCIGAPLARLEMRVALEQLTKRLRDVRLSASNRFEYEPSFILRGLSALDLDVERADA